MKQLRFATFLFTALLAGIGGLMTFSCEAKEWPGFSRGMGIGGWLYYEIVKGLQ